MKKINHIILILALAVGLYSCQGSLLDTNPYDSVGSEQMWTNENLTDMGVLAIYETLRYSKVGYEIYFNDEFGFTGQGRDVTTLCSGSITAGSSLFSDTWKQLYEGVSRANDAITNIPLKYPVSEDKKDRLIAEAKFMRAYFYYRLNELFKGVPVYLEATPAEEFTKGRETEAKVWEVVINDLTDCINSPQLPGRYEKGNANYGRATKAMAYALRGKTYMWMKEYAKAEADLKKVGEFGHKLFEGSYKKLFKEENEQCEEMIFSVQNIGMKGYGSTTQFRLGTRVSFGSCWNTYLPNPDFVDSYENADGSPFNWDDYIPGYNSMTPRQREVYFLRDGLTAEEIETFKEKGADMSKYLPAGNEARIRKVYESRDPRLMASIITPYSTYLGAIDMDEHTYTLRWPYRGFDTSEPFDIRTHTSTIFYYLYRKFVYEGASETTNREYGPIDQPLIRYADVVLLLAEALNEQGKTEEAIPYVNSVRKRAGAALLNSNEFTKVKGQDDMRNRIRNERRWEFVIEGVNFFDEMRWHTLKETKFNGGTNCGTKAATGEIVFPNIWSGDYMYKWPIPSAECERNGNLEQNEGWIN